MGHMAEKIKSDQQPVMKGGQKPAFRGINGCFALVKFSNKRR
jgi:hypothetical protein